MGISVSYNRHYYRRLLGKLCMGHILELGPERDMVCHCVADICRLSARACNSRLERCKDCRICHNRFYCNSIPLLGSELYLTGAACVCVEGLRGGLMEDAKKENGKKYGIIVAVVLIILAGIALYEWSNFESYKPVVIGGPAPDFELKDLSKKSMKLSDYKGKVVFLNFWATWCKPCKEEMPSMELLYKAKKGKDFEMLAVSIDRDIAKVEPFVKELKLTFPVALDFMGKADRRYKLTGVPETYIIDQNGVIVEKILGPRDWTRPESIQTILGLLKKGQGK